MALDIYYVSEIHAGIQRNDSSENISVRKRKENNLENGRPYLPVTFCTLKEMFY